MATHKELRAHVEELHDLIDDLLLGTRLDDCGNRDDDGLLAPYSEVNIKRLRIVGARLMDRRRAGP